LARSSHPRASVLAVKGIDDEYGTLAAVRCIASRWKRVELLELADLRALGPAPRPAPMP